MLRKGSDFFEESNEKRWGKESANESGLKFIPYFDIPSLSSSSHVFASLVSDRENIIRRTTSFLFPLTRVNWLPLMANSFAVLGMVIVELGVGATTRSAAYIGSSSIGLWFVSLFEWNSLVSSTKSSIQDQVDHKKMTLEEYDKELDEKKKELVSLKSEERNVVSHNDLAKMQLV
ncbi:hypothetical protein Tco_0052204 [Tanacetum coccineum]